MVVFCHLFVRLWYVEGMQKGQQRGTRVLQRMERGDLEELLEIIEFDP